MARNPSMRASDGDRDRVAAALREHCAQGRLSLEEFRQRLDATYSAVTIGDLEKITADLPEEDLYQLPVPASKRSQPARRGRRDVDRRHRSALAAWGSWATVNLVCIAIWLLVSVSAGELTYPWWIWVAGPWGAVLLAGTLLGRRDRGGRG